MDFVDLTGASGVSYRFRRWPVSGGHPPIAGNFAVVSERTRKLIALGAMDDLSRARLELERLPRGAVLFTRLNVARAVREAEHGDLAQAHPEAAASKGLQDLDAEAA